MAGMTLAQAEARLALYLKAEEDILERGQSYAIKGRALTRANLKEISETIQSLQALCERLAGTGGVRRKRLVPQ
jgi:hypothetical protein